MSNGRLMYSKLEKSFQLVRLGGINLANKEFYLQNKNINVTQRMGKENLEKLTVNLVIKQ